METFADLFQIGYFIFCLLLFLMLVVAPFLRNPPGR